MASMGGYLDPEPLIRMIKNTGMINKALKQICISEGLSKVGVKAELQNRLVESESICSASRSCLSLGFTKTSSVF